MVLLLCALPGGGTEGREGGGGEGTRGGEHEVEHGGEGEDGREQGVGEHGGEHAEHEGEHGEHGGEHGEHEGEHGEHGGEHGEPRGAHGGEEGEEEEEEEEEGEKEEEEEGEEEEEEVDPVSKAGAAILVAMIILFAGVFYLANHRSHDVVSATYEMGSYTLSIFLAISYYQAVDNAVFEIVDKTPAHTENHDAFFWIHGFHFWGWHIGTVMLIMVLSHYGQRAMKAASMLGAHVCGFAGRAMLKALCGVEALSDPLGALVATIFIGVVIILLVIGVDNIIRNLVEGCGPGKAHKEEIADSVQEANTDLACLSLASHTLYVFMFFVLQERPGIHHHGHEEELSAAESTILVGLAIVFSVATIVLTHLVRDPKCLKVAWSKQAIEIGQTLCTMFMAFSSLDFAQSMLHSSRVSNSDMLGRAQVALCMTAFAGCMFLVMVGLVYLSGSRLLKKSISVMVMGIGVVVGLSWEETLDLAIEDLAIGAGSLSETAAKFLLSIVLLIVLFPAWYLFILPHALRDPVASADSVHSVPSTTPDPAVLGSKEAEASL